MEQLGFLSGAGVKVETLRKRLSSKSCARRAVTVAVIEQSRSTRQDAHTSEKVYSIPNDETAFERRPVQELPDGISLSDVVKSMPREVFEIDEKKSWLHFLVTAIAVPLSLVLVNYSPWFLLPVTWFIAGTAATGLFTIGHDAGHNSFSKNPLINDIVGNLTHSMLVYPFEPWRIQHNIHHRNTNMIKDEKVRGAEIADNAWQPIGLEFFRNSSSPEKLSRTIAAFHDLFYYFGSIIHWVHFHMDLNKFTANQRPKVIVSWFCCALFAAVAFPTLFALGGPWAFIKFWLMPWLGYHFWMSTFTLIHHTAPHIQFKDKAEWNAAKAQLSGTVHCNFPRWIEILTHDINVHIPHHVSTRIPSYNLKAAHRSLQEKWGPYLNETTFSFKLRNEILRNCQVFDNGEYISFKEAVRRVALRKA